MGWCDLLNIGVYTSFGLILLGIILLSVMVLFRYLEKLKAKQLAQEINSKNEIERHNAKLKRSIKERDEFSSIAFHDLKAPMRAIKQLAHWIQEDIDDPSPEVLEHLDLMSNRVGRLEMLLDDLLVYSRSGRNHGESETIDIDSTLREVFQGLSPPPEFSLVSDANIPEFNTWSVPLKLILHNLIGNAIKHHDRKDGTITVVVEATEEGIGFTISDDGPGIPPQHHQRVFDLFQTLKPRDDLEASGMGLSIIKKILDGFDCNIYIESDGIRGTSIQFNWPTEPKLRSYIND